MSHLTLSLLEASCRPGGASSLAIKTELAPAAGDHAGVAPARYVRGSSATYAFSTRFISSDTGETSPQRVAQLDSKGSSINRIEEALSQAIEDGEEPLAQTPRIRLKYTSGEVAHDYDLPHRAFDGHIRAGTVAGTPVTATPAYRAVRDASQSNCRAMLETAPAGLLFGAWDSTRKSNQARFRSILVGETIGVLADQSPNGDRVDDRGGARVDPIAPSVRLAANEMRELLDAQRHELSEGNVKRIEEGLKKAKGGKLSAAALGLGAIPPSLTQLGLVSCSRILRTHVLSFAALRQLRFGLGVDGDASARALLAAFGLAALVRSYAELTFRADCDLREAGRPVVELDARYGQIEMIAFPEVEEVDAILSAAIDKARTFGIKWDGQVLEVVGSPLISGGIVVDEDSE